MHLVLELVCNWKVVPKMVYALRAMALLRLEAVWEKLSVLVLAAAGARNSQVVLREVAQIISAISRPVKPRLLRVAINRCKEGLKDEAMVSPPHLSLLTISLLDSCAHPHLG